MRFFNLGIKPYWYDEVYTSLRLSGYTKVDIFERFGTEQGYFKDLKNFQCPSNDRDLGDVLNGLITDDIHPPLYFTLLYYWTKIGGCSISHLRLFSALSSLLLILISYVFVYEIFNSREIALLTTVLVTNSPIFLIYAQEARHYILLMLLALASSVTLLRYLDGKTLEKQEDISSKGEHFPASSKKYPKDFKNLSIYCFLSTAGLYCHTLYYLVIMGQVGYCFFKPVQKSNTTFSLIDLINNLISNIRLNKNIFIAILLSFLGFLIWIFRVINLKGFEISVGADYTWKEFPLGILWQRIALNFTSLINDFDSEIKSEILTKNVISYSLSSLSFSHILIILLICSTFLFSIWYMIQYSDRSRTILLAWLALPSVLFLIKDLLLGGSASSIIRYQLLSVFGLYTSLSFCLIHLFKFTSLKWVKGFVIALIFLLCQMQINSNIHYLNASTWWSKYGDYRLPEFARSVNQSSYPIILGEADYREMVNLLKLSYILSPSVPFKLVKEEELSKNSLNLNSHNIFWIPKI